MKNIKFFFQGLVLSFLMVIYFAGCTKTNQTNIKDTFIRNTYENMEISALDTLTFSLGLFGIEDGASIVNQAKHYIISELRRDDGMEIIYYYLAEPGFRGIDQVDILSTSGSDGSSVGSNRDLINLTISVVD